MREYSRGDSIVSFGAEFEMAKGQKSYEKEQFIRLYAFGYNKEDFKKYVGMGKDIFQISKEIAHPRKCQ